MCVLAQMNVPKATMFLNKVLLWDCLKDSIYLPRLSWKKVQGTRRLLFTAMSVFCLIWSLIAAKRTCSFPISASLILQEFLGLSSWSPSYSSIVACMIQYHVPNECHADWGDPHDVQKQLWPQFCHLCTSLGFGWWDLMRKEWLVQLTTVGLSWTCSAFTGYTAGILLRVLFWV